LLLAYRFPDLTIIGVIVITIVVQLIDNNIIVPLIVSSKAVNAFISTVGTTIMVQLQAFPNV
jgi:predicted PurR-regulated permease PerM